MAVDPLKKDVCRKKNERNFISREINDSMI